jgi:hypothetical protein
MMTTPHFRFQNHLLINNPKSNAIPNTPQVLYNSKIFSHKFGCQNPQIYEKSRHTKKGILFGIPAHRRAIAGLHGRFCLSVGLTITEGQKQGRMQRAEIRKRR